MLFLLVRIRILFDILVCLNNIYFIYFIDILYSFWFSVNIEKVKKKYLFLNINNI